MRTVRCLLIGVGNLGRRFCELMQLKNSWLAERYGLLFQLVGVADSRGAAYAAGGLDWATVAQLKHAGQSVGDYPRVGRRDWPATALVAEAQAELLLEASPVHLAQGAEPGLTCIRTALRRGMAVVTPNKGPLVVAYRELQNLAAAHGVPLRFDGTVAGGLPAINLGQRDLRGAVIHRLEAVPNLVTGFILDLLAAGVAWDEACAQAYAEGVLEGDGSWDLEGWDAAAKLVILANAVLDYPARLEDVTRQGITTLEVALVRAACERGQRYRLLTRAERRPDGSYALSARPTLLPPEHPLGQLGSKQIGVVYYTDIYGTITATIDEPDPLPSAATMLRDALDIFVA